MTTSIRINVRTVDRSNTTRTFKTLKGARKYAVSRVGQSPEISEMFGYAVGTFGDVKLTVSGTSLASLFEVEPVYEMTLAKYRQLQGEGAFWSGSEERGAFESMSPSDQATYRADLKAYEEEQRAERARSQAASEADPDPIPF